MAQPVILGIDEVGRGPWAGPLVVGAVILGERFLPDYRTQNPELEKCWQNLTDSKKLTELRRQTLSDQILQNASATGLGWVSSQELDQYGLSASLKLATRRAVKLVLKAQISFDQIIIDGTVNFLQNTPLADRVTTLKKADFLIKEVSAASVIAKVARDNYMKKLAELYPDYGFEKHVGYGTAFHKKALQDHGPCPEHRQTFRPIRELAGGQPQNMMKQSTIPKIEHVASISQSNVTHGKLAEHCVKLFLESQGHEILAQNYRTKSYEIDLISRQTSTLFFTEVKYRQKTHQGQALEQVTTQKRQQMHFAAQGFLASHPEYQSFQPQLAVASVEGADYELKDWFILE